MPDDGKIPPNSTAPTRRRAKLFTHGGSQAVRLPKEFRFDGHEVMIRKQGDAVILTPVERDWTAFWARIDRLRGDAQLEAPEDPPAEDPKTGW
jgi:antitoxin VapB